MDKGADTTQRIVVIIAVILGILMVLTIGYSLYQKAKKAEGELASKVALDNATKKASSQANVSLTGESQNSSNFNYDGLVQKRSEEEATTTNFEIVNETIPVEVPEEIVPIEEPEPAPPAPKPKPKPVYVDDGDRPLTAEEIRAIRQLPVDDSPSGNLQNTLETDSNGQYRARYE